MVIHAGAAVLFGLTCLVGIGTPALVNFYSSSIAKNQEMLDTFLEKQFGQEIIGKIQFQEPQKDDHRDGVFLIPFQLEYKIYTLELELEKSFLRNYIFTDARLYNPINLVLN